MALALRSRPRVRSKIATRIGEYNGDRLLALVAGELANLGCSEAGRLYNSYVEISRNSSSGRTRDHPCLAGSPTSQWTCGKMLCGGDGDTNKYVDRGETFAIGVIVWIVEHHDTPKVVMPNVV